MGIEDTNNLKQSTDNMLDDDYDNENSSDANNDKVYISFMIIFLIEAD